MIPTASFFFTLLCLSLPSRSSTYSAETKAITPLRPRLAILGDSYASGIGAGTFVSAHPHDLFCNRFTGAYGYQLAGDERFLPSYEFKACAGAKMKDMRRQFHHLRSKGPFDYVTLSIIGNDFSFAKLVNNCIYQFTNLVGLNWDERCAKTMARIEAGLFNQPTWEQYQEVLKDTMDLVHENGKVFVTGYTKFFGTPVAHGACGSMSWSPHPRGSLLRATMRQRLNSMVQSVNERVQMSIDHVNQQLNTTMFEYIDINALFDDHRFCEKGQTRGSDDPDVWTLDFLTSFGNKLGLQAKVLSNDLSDLSNANALAQDYQRVLSEDSLDLPGLPRSRSAGVNDSLPEAEPPERSLLDPLLKFTRVFHPKPHAHTAIKERILARTGMSVRPARALAPAAATLRPIEALPETIEGTFAPYTPRQLLGLLRGAVCGAGACERPMELPAHAVQVTRGAVDERNAFVRGRQTCEVAMRLPSGIEAFASRGPLTTACDAVLGNMTDTLVEQSPYAYEWEGAIQYERYALGFRPRAKHAAD